MRVKNKIFIILLVLILVSTAGIVYLNKVLLPQKIKAVIISNIEQAIQKKVSLRILEFNIFKGLVLKDLVIFDKENKLLGIKEISCAFILLPLFKKNIIIPSLTVRNLDIFVERRADNSINILQLLPKKATGSVGPGFKVFIYRLSILDGHIDFQDNTLSPQFSKSIDNLNLVFSFGLPDSLRFNLKAEIPNKPLAKIMASGNLGLKSKQLAAKITVRDFSPQDFAGYSNIEGIYAGGGLVDAVVNLNYKDGLLDIISESKIKNLSIRRDRLSADLNSDLKFNLKYNLDNKQLEYAGKANIASLNIRGLELVDTIGEVAGQVRFDNSGLIADKLSAHLLGQPVEGEFSLNNFKSPVLNMHIVCGINLEVIQRILKDKFNFSLPGALEGKGRLDFVLATALPVVSGQPQIKGSLNITDAKMQLEKVSSPFENIAGRLDFTQDKLVWSGLNFKYQDTLYKTSGQLINFQSPEVHLGLISPGFSLESDLVVRDKLVNLKNLSGSYLQSAFNIAGAVDTSIPGVWGANIKGAIDINLIDLKAFLKNYKGQLERIKPSGVIHSQLDIQGDLGNIKSCDIQAKLTGDTLSIYGLKCEKLNLDYRQGAGLAQIPLAQLFLYDGTIEATAKMNLEEPSLPYSAELNMQAVSIEKLKLDTPMKDEDISGIIQVQAELNGFAQGLSRLSGAGRILVSNGRLWQLHLFKGLGELLFTRDFGNIVFSEGYCDFQIKDQSILTDNLKLKSNLLNLSGKGRIGFDGVLDISINTQVNKGAGFQVGRVGDIAAVLLGEAGRLAVIKLGGTLGEPKYRLQPAVVDIVKGLKDFIVRNIGE